MRNIRGCYMMWCLYTGCDPGRLHITEVLETVPRYLDIRRKCVATENSNVFAEKRAQAARVFLSLSWATWHPAPSEIWTAQRTEKSRTRPRKATLSLGPRREIPRSEFGI